MRSYITRPIHAPFQYAGTPTDKEGIFSANRSRFCSRAFSSFKLLHSRSKRRICSSFGTSYVTSQPLCERLCEIITRPLVSGPVFLRNSSATIRASSACRYFEFCRLIKNDCIPLTKATILAGMYKKSKKSKKHITRKNENKNNIISN